MKHLFATAAATVFLAAAGLAQAGDTVLIITHEVKDFATWKAGYDRDKEGRDKAGVTVQYLLRGAENPNVVTVVMEAADAAKARAFATNPALKDVMTKAGVISAPVITIANKAK
jgi:hypothetical protein